MKYALEIIQQCGGESNTVAVDASGGLYGSLLVLHYIFDGAEYRLEIGGSEMVEKRFGAIRLSMRFIEGRTTAARFDDGVNGGEFPIYTRKLEIKSDGADRKVNCEFSYGEGGEITKITVSAAVLQ